MSFGENKGRATGGVLQVNAAGYFNNRSNLPRPPRPTPGAQRRYGNLGYNALRPPGSS